MPFRNLALQPGVDTQHTPTLNQAKLATSNLIRFRAGMVEKRGGWQQLTAQTLIGTCSGLHAFDDLNANVYIAAGTEQRLEIFIGGLLSDITPIVATGNPASAFSTTTGSPIITVTDASHDPSINDWVYIPTPVSIGGLVLFGFYQVTGIPGANQYTFNAASTATSTVTNGGVVPVYTTTSGSATVQVTFPNNGLNVGGIYNAVVATTVAGITISGMYSVISVIDVNNFTITASAVANAGTTASMNGGNAQIQYLLPTGFAQDTVLSGYGAGDYGSGDYGGSQGGVAATPARIWSLDNFGQVLIASPSNGGIYQWTPPNISPAAVVSSTAPLYNEAVFVLSQAQIVVALGAEVFGVQQPLLIRWSDAGDYTDWTPTVDNEAGSFTIPYGNKLVGGLAAGLTAILWTDDSVYAMTYQGLPFVFGFQPIAQRCGLIGPRCFAVIGQIIFWISPHGFFEMSMGGGAPTLVPCDVWDILYDNWDLSQPGLFHMGESPTHNEFELHFPIASSSPLYVVGSITRGTIKFNYVENAWDYTISSQLQRTAWLGHSVQSGPSPDVPLGTDPTGLILQHEIGWDANGVPLLWSYQTADAYIGEGEDIAFVDWMLPDFITLNSPTIQISLLFRNLPSDAYTTVGPFTWSQASAFIPMFAGRGRQMALLIQGSDLGTFNRLGKLRYRFAPDGRGF